MYKFIRCRRRIFSRYLRNHLPMLSQENLKLGHLAQPPRSSLKLLLNSSRATLTRRPSATSSAASSITGSFQKTGNFTDGPLTSYPRVTSSSIYRTPRRYIVFGYISYLHESIGRSTSFGKSVRPLLFKRNERGGLASAESHRRDHLLQEYSGHLHRRCLSRDSLRPEYGVERRGRCVWRL